MLANGPVLKTQELGKVYAQGKGLSLTKVQKKSIELYDIFCQHLNVLQMYVFNQAYLVPNTPHIVEVILSLTSIIDETNM